MSTGARRSLESAEADAQAFVRLFVGAFTRWEIAGSVRRRVPEVGDVEHVVIGDIWPILEDLLPAPGLFGGPVGTVEKAVYQDGTHRWGPKYRGVIYRGFRHEIFLADEDNFGIMLAIRTGSAEFSRHLVTNLKARGDYRMEDGYVFDAKGQRVRVATEEFFFFLCGQSPVPPENR